MEDATGDCDKQETTASVSLPCRRPGEQLILQQQIRVNGRIRAREVRVILGSTSEQLGIMKLSEAIKKAQSLGSIWWKSRPPPTRQCAKSSISENSVTTFPSR
jgi:hypothetical protein